LLNRLVLLVHLKCMDITPSVISSKPRLDNPLGEIIASGRGLGFVIQLCGRKSHMRESAGLRESKKTYSGLNE